MSINSVPCLRIHTTRQDKPRYKMSVSTLQSPATTPTMECEKITLSFHYYVKNIYNYRFQTLNFPLKVYKSFMKLHFGSEKFPNKFYHYDDGFNHLTFPPISRKLVQGSKISTSEIPSLTKYQTYH